MAGTTSILKKAQTYAYFCHEVANHLYDGKPYKTHLDLAFKFGFKYRHLLKEERGRIAPIDVLAGIFV